MFKMALDLTPSDRELCSQSTISRLENLPDVRALLRVGRAMVDLYCGSFHKVPKRITLYIDDTFDAVHGGQQLRLFNAHYDEYGFQPIVVFDGEGRFVTAVLRPAKRPSGKEVKPFLRRLLRAIRAHWPNTEILLRAAGKGRRAILVIDEGNSLATTRAEDHSHHEDKVGVNTLIQSIDDLRR